MDVATGNRLIGLRERIVADFDHGNWEELGLLTGRSGIINGHSRLLRSLSWGDEDYSGNVLTVLRRMVEEDSRVLPIIESYLDQTFPGESHFISAKPAERKITFAPNVFEVPESYVEPDLVAVMMPFAQEFNAVHAAIKRACEETRLRCLRVDDIWEESVIVQDIFNLIFRAQVVVADFSGRNPNVMYETGIAHTLGKHVVPISQSLSDVPFDMSHHRILRYLPNGEGLSELRKKLGSRLYHLCIVPRNTDTSDADDEEIPF